MARQLLLWIFAIVFAIFSCLVVTCWKRADLLALLQCDVSLCNGYIPIRYPGSGVALDCIGSFLFKLMCTW